MNSFPNAYITQDDMDWIDKNVWNCPNYDRIQGHILTLQQEKVFKKAAMQDGHSARTLKLENTFAGKIGEALVKKLYPMFEFSADKYALFDCLLGEKKFDIKTCTAQNVNFHDGWYVAVPRHWIDNRDYEAIVFCHYNMEKRRISVLGWQYKAILLDPDRLIVKKKGEKCDNKWGTFMFTALQDTYLWDSSTLRSMSDLPLEIPT